MKKFMNEMKITHPTDPSKNHMFSSCCRGHETLERAQECREFQKKFLREGIGEILDPECTYEQRIVDVTSGEVVGSSEDIMIEGHA